MLGLLQASLRASGLPIEQASILAMRNAQQALVIAFFDDAALVEDEDAIQRSHRRQAMRDDD